MRVLPHLRRRIERRCLALYRADPAAVARHLPDGTEPTTVQGYALVAACFTRLARPEPIWLPHALSGGRDELAYVFLTSTGGSRAAWTPFRRSSSRIRTRWPGRAAGCELRHSFFELDESAGGVELRVTSKDGEDLYLRAESAGGHDLLGSLFPSAREAEAFLDACRADLVPGGGELADPEEAETAGGRWAVDALTVFELRCRAFDDSELFPHGTIRPDCALRWIRRLPARRPAVELRPADELALPDTAGPLPA